MTVPFAPPPSRPILAVLAAMLAVAVAIPFARREDWLGWAAIIAVVAANVVMWGLMARALISRRREPPDSK